MVVDDILDLKSRLIDAIKKSDYERMNFLLYAMLHKCDQMSPAARTAVALSIEDSLISFSSMPNLLEDGLFTIFAISMKFLPEWEEKYHPIYTKKGDMLFFTFSPAQDIFQDSLFSASSVVLGLIYRIIIKSSELSEKNLIRCSNFLLFLLAGDLDLNKRSKFFYTSILLIIVQLAAKAKSLKLEPLNEKLFVLLKKFDKNWLDEILKISLEKANPFAKMGDIDVILATKNEILSLRDELNK